MIRVLRVYNTATGKLDKFQLEGGKSDIQDLFFALEFYCKNASGQKIDVIKLRDRIKAALDNIRNGL